VKLNGGGRVGDVEGGVGEADGHGRRAGVDRVALVSVALALLPAASKVVTAASRVRSASATRSLPATSMLKDRSAETVPV